MPGYRKRKFSSGPMRRFKKRRFGGRRRSTRARTKSWTTQTGGGQSMRYRSKRLSGKKWRNLLWRNTLASQHWRSVGLGASAPVTGTTIGVGVVTINLPTFVGTPGPTTAFWTATGGVLPADEGEATPIFQAADFVIRGGQIGITVSAPDTVPDRDWETHHQ